MATDGGKGEEDGPAALVIPKSPWAQEGKAGPKTAVCSYCGAPASNVGVGSDGNVFCGLGRCLVASKVPTSPRVAAVRRAHAAHGPAAGTAGGSRTAGPSDASPRLRMAKGLFGSNNSLASLGSVGSLGSDASAGSDKEEEEEQPPRPRSMRGACVRGEIDVVRDIVEKRVSEVDRANHHGTTPFLHACFHGQLEIAKFLSEAVGVDVERANDAGLTAFYGACW